MIRYSRRLSLTPSHACMRSRSAKLDLHDMQAAGHRPWRMAEGIIEGVIEGVQTWPHVSMVCRCKQFQSPKGEDRPEVETLLEQGTHILCLLVHRRLRRDDAAVLLMHRCILNDLHAWLRRLTVPLQSDPRGHSPGPARRFALTGARSVLPQGQCLDRTKNHVSGEAGSTVSSIENLQHVRALRYV